MPTRFRDRKEAGQTLAHRLEQYAGRSDVIVLALPRGGVPVAAEVARALGAPLDVFLVRKLGVPGQEELAMGAIAENGIRVLNEDVFPCIAVSPAALEAATARERHELERRSHLYRGGRSPVDVRGRTVILVDDGLATGTTMQAAVAALRELEPAAIVVAVPVASSAACSLFTNRYADVSCVCLYIPKAFEAVGLWYEDFNQTTDGEVRELLNTLAGRA
jgi:predicted phosphoribosyltransferase